MVTSAEIIDILTGTELAGRTEDIYRASFAVPNRLFGVAEGGNRSGISFGVVQLDIGNNSFAQSAYRDIMAVARFSPIGIIGDDDYARLLSYNGVRRPDLNGELSSSLRSDLQLLSAILQDESARAVVDRYSRNYVEQELRGTVNNFLDAVREQWGEGTVFDPRHPDYATALAAMVSIANRTGGLGGSTDYFLLNKPEDLADVRARYDAVLGDHWDLVVIGGQMFANRQECFLAGTPVTMADGSTKPIEQVRPGDWVTSFDQKTGETKPGRVKRTMQNRAKIVLDFHGTFVTPGHVYWCAGGTFEGRFVPLIDILRDDGVIQHQDGTLIRAATGCEVGSPDDEQFWAFLTREEGDTDRIIDKRQLRFGTRWMLPDGRHFTMREYMAGIGAVPQPDGSMLFTREGIVAPFVWVLSDALPNPEDFVLARSRTTLADIYRAGEWEGQQPAMPPPLVRDGGPVQALSVARLAGMKRNVPVSLEGGPASSTLLPERRMNRHDRKVEAARQRHEAKRKARLH